MIVFFQGLGCGFLQYTQKGLERPFGQHLSRNPAWGPGLEIAACLFPGYRHADFRVTGVPRS